MFSWKGKAASEIKVFFSVSVYFMHKENTMLKLYPNRINFHKESRKDKS